MDESLPNGEIAIVEIGKLTDYCLAAEHVRGKHKARVFSAALGVRREHAAELRSFLLAAARSAKAVRLRTDGWGDHWRVDATMTRQKRQAVVRSLWIIRTGELAPHFVTCWIL